MDKLNRMAQDKGSQAGVAELADVAGFKISGDIKHGGSNPSSGSPRSQKQEALIIFRTNRLLRLPSRFIGSGVNEENTGSKWPEICIMCGLRKGQHVTSDLDEPYCHYPKVLKHLFPDKEVPDGFED